MLNIISRSLIFKNISGPKKVVVNLMKGLDLLGYPYVINKRLDACKRLWIHDDRIALKKISSLSSEIKVIIGPNLYNLPKNIPADLALKRAIYIQPSLWVKDCWEYFGFNKCILDVWPTGIDTEEFKPSAEKKESVLIYFKLRFDDELKQVEKVLKSKNLTYKILDYSKNYEEEEYKELLAKSKYIIWLGRQESQGIALQEALCSGVPVLIWDVKYMGHWQVSKKNAAIFNEAEKNYKNTTSAYYFDSRCGIKIKEASELETAIDFMEKNLNIFKPRKYILENLSLEKQARDFLTLYEKHFGLSYRSGFQEKVIRDGDWLNSKFYYKIYLKIKHFIKVILIKTGIWDYIK